MPIINFYFRPTDELRRTNTLPKDVSVFFELDGTNENVLNKQDNAAMATKPRFDVRKLQNFENLFKNLVIETDPVGETDNYDDIFLDKEERKILEYSKCLIRGHSIFKLRWDVFIMFLAIFNCFSIPFEVAFDPPAMNTLWFLLLNSIIDI